MNEDDIEVSCSMAWDYLVERTEDELRESLAQYRIGEFDNADAYFFASSDADAAEVSARHAEIIEGILDARARGENPGPTVYAINSDYEQ